MEFSSSYNNTMQQLSQPNPYLNETQRSNTQSISNSPLEMVFKVTMGGGEIPLMAYYPTLHLLLEHRERISLDSPTNIVIPLVLEDNFQIRTGADAILRSFTSRYSRLNMTETPKGEIYYGGNGLILDKNFSPLLYITKQLVIVNGREQPGTTATVHVSPSIFTDDVSVLNKSLLRKGVAYFLTHDIGRVNRWDTRTSVHPNIVIDDGKDIFRKPNKPEFGSSINSKVNALLRDNIKDILGQIAYDSSNFE